jgi:hypothetical protein
MFWKKKEEDEVIVLDKPLQPGQIVGCNNPETVKIIAPDPEPDLSTKPQDIIGYCFGFACANKHVDNLLEEINSKTFGIVKMCQICGKISKLCKVKRTAEAQWREEYNPYRISNNVQKFEWIQCYFHGLSILWTQREFAGFLKLSVDKGKKRRK